MSDCASTSFVRVNIREEVVSSGTCPAGRCLVEWCNSLVTSKALLYETRTLKE